LRAATSAISLADSSSITNLSPTPSENVKICRTCSVRGRFFFMLRATYFRPPGSRQWNSCANLGVNSGPLQF
jgi:hypothetical protein